MNATFKRVLALVLAVLPAVAPAQAQQACQAMAEQVRSYKPPADGTFLFPLQGLDQIPGSVVQLSRKQPIEALRSRFRPTPELLKAVKAMDYLSNDGAALWDIGQGLQALEVNGGTAHCAGFVFFADEPNGQALVELPPSIRQPKEGSMQLCSGAGSEGLVGTVLGTPAFFLQEGMDQEFDITVSQWRNKAWQPDCTLSIRFDAAFSIGERFCKGVDCEAAAAAGLALAKRFDDNDQLPEQEKAKLSAVERKTFENAPPFPEKTLPTFGSTAEFHDFGCDEAVVPVKIGGQLYVGRLGHGSIGWRCFNDFVFALYTVKNGEAQPVAGVTIDKVRAAPVAATVK